MIRKTFFILAILLGVGLNTLYARTGRMNELCPVMKGSRAKQKFSENYQGRRVFFCCRSCVRSFQKHPERYADRLALARNS